MSADFWQVAERVCTTRELAVLRLDAKGLTVDAIGRVLAMAPARVTALAERAANRVCDALDGAA